MDIDELKKYTFKVCMHPNEIYNVCAADKAAVNLMKSFKEFSDLNTLNYGKNGYITYIERQEDITIVTYSLFFVFNDCIGPISNLLKKFEPFSHKTWLDRLMYKLALVFDYHDKDSVDFTVIFNNKTKKPVKVNYDAHSRGQGMWVNWHDVPKINITSSDGKMVEIPVIYIALGSHSAYPKPLRYWRIFGLGNDVCSTGGKEYVIATHINLYDMDEDTNTDWQSIRECGFGVQRRPSEHTITSWQRFFLPFYLRYLNNT